MPAVDPTKLIKSLTHPEGLGTLLDALPLGVAVMDRKGTLIAVNKRYEELTGIDGDKALGLRCLHALRCDLCMKGCPVVTGWKNNKMVMAEGNILTRSREKVAIHLTLSPLLGERGNLRGMVETVSSVHDHVLDEIVSGVGGLGELVGRSPQVRKIFSMTPSIAQTDSPVLIIGETGTGKDMLAEEIHNESDRDGPFIKINCGALPEQLLESELFGHTKNALPGADHAKPGRLRMAHGGTLFFTEIGELPLPLQAKLLAYMDDHSVRPMGSAKVIHTDVRIMAASHYNLEERVQRKQFRRDLLYRLNVIQLHLPPLRERGEDLLLLQDHFHKMFKARYKKDVTRFSRNVETLLKSYPFPGNVRELRNLIEYAVNFCDGDVIRMRHLPGYILHSPEVSGNVPSKPASRPAPDELRTPPPERWEDVQRKMIIEALVKAGGKKALAAEILGWGRSTLWRKMKHFKID